MRRGCWQAIASVAFAIAVLGSAVTQVRSAGDESLPEMISSAKTAADHQEIATYYDAAARDAKQRTEEHEKMMQAYKSLGGALVGKLQLEQHCARLTTSSQNDVADYESLATAHRTMAENVPK